jgi:hypothetical protein
MPPKKKSDSAQPKAKPKAAPKEPVKGTRYTWSDDLVWKLIKHLDDGDVHIVLYGKKDPGEVCGVCSSKYGTIQ